MKAILFRTLQLFLNGALASRAAGWTMQGHTFDMLESLLKQVECDVIDIMNP